MTGKMGFLKLCPKRGDLIQCSNWRGIALLSVPRKVFCKSILEILSEAIEPLLIKEQAGSHRTGSCVDQINTLRIILEKASKWQKKV